MAQHSQALDLEEALRTIRDRLSSPITHETCPIADSLGRAVAAPVTAALSLPPFTASAMDGYAVRSADLNANAGYSLQQIGTSLAGHPFNGSVRHGQCVRIFTGAALPEGADLVVVQENVTHEDAGQVSFIPHTSKDTNVRAIGNDIAAGQVLVDTGETINPFLLGHLAAAGVTELPVFTKVRVGIFSSGDELRDPGTPVDQLRYGDIYDANRITLLQLLKGLPVDCVDLGCLPDDPEAVSSALSSAALTCDVLLTSGGVSVGDADFIVEQIQRQGELQFWRLNLKPGKPLAFGRIDNCWIFGLPGNPVSTIITALLLARPAIAFLAGVNLEKPLTLSAVLATPIQHSPGRTEFQRGQFHQDETGFKVSHTGEQGSNRFSSFRYANCLIEIDKEQGNLQMGDVVNILPLVNLLH
ncbi:MAG: gephyrin-like molybdotransferase Glp [Pseudomonadota bacterium]|nr:gephyrin-like molybdotransferase Glp [Pseudomonadota bacterium]MEC7139594.1 gephyrin-like molybdotransferase Glp [Pseudomonadota bacterium]MEC7250521.1 gephyrin-like molybdotransferase Glp [Pseudomonadota bacterium]MEC7378985.1 gephyrin-like molybdotransferase Glp [Pseudomonadota bacterium]MEC8807967.1 gephyrin-like molybdotransferase Glp [Pseudomonadota bacterium]